jgi:hypothetical protein
MNPTTLMLIGSGLSAATSLQQGAAAKQQGAMQGELLRRDAVRTKQIGERDSAEFARSMSRLMGTRRAEGGATGVERSGTVLDVDQNVIAEGEFQRQKILSGATAAAQKQELQATFAEMAGINKQRNSRLRAGSQIFTGAAESGAFGKL